MPILLVILAAVSVYLPTLNSYFLADDFHLFGWPSGYGKRNFLQTLGPYVRPLPATSMHLEYKLWGLNPLPPHATNMALHAGCSVLLSTLALRLAGNRTIAWIAGMLFALHPIHTGAVSWLSARFDLFLAVFSLASVLHFDDYMQSKRKFPLVLSLLWLCCALLSKEPAVALPPILFAWALLRRPRGAPLPWAGLGLAWAFIPAYLGIRVLAFGEVNLSSGPTPELTRLAFDLTVTPLKYLLFPADKSLWSQWFLVPALATILLAFATLSLWLAGLLARARERGFRLTQSTTIRAVVFGICLHQICMLVMYSVAGNLNSPQVPTRLLYLPSAGYCLILAVLLGSLSQRPRRILSVAWFGLFTVLTVGNNLAWRQAGSLSRTITNQVQAAVKADGKAHRKVLFSDLPMYCHGAYVFLPTAIRSALSLQLPVTPTVLESTDHPVHRRNDLRMEMPIRDMLVLRWNRETSTIEDISNRTRKASRSYMQLPWKPKQWTGQQLQRWSTAASGFTVDASGLHGIAEQRQVGIRSPRIPLNTALVEVRLSLQAPQGVALESLPRVTPLLAKWRESSDAATVLTIRRNPEPGSEQTLSIPYPVAAELAHLERKGLELELLFLAPGYELTITGIRTRLLEITPKGPRKSRKQPSQGPPQQSGDPHSRSPARASKER